MNRKGPLIYTINWIEPRVGEADISSSSKLVPFSALPVPFVRLQRASEREGGRVASLVAAFIKRAVLQKHQSYVLGIDDQPPAKKLHHSHLCRRVWNKTRAGVALLFRAARKKPKRIARRVSIPRKRRAVRREQSERRQHSTTIIIIRSFGRNVGGDDDGGEENALFPPSAAMNWKFATPPQPRFNSTSNMKRSRRQIFRDKCL